MQIKYKRVVTQVTEHKLGESVLPCLLIQMIMQSDPLLIVLLQLSHKNDCLMQLALGKNAFFYFLNGEYSPGGGEELTRLFVYTDISELS